MNISTSLACLAVLAVFGVGWFVTGWWAQWVRSKKPKLEKVCAWCQRERGETPQRNQTHGICREHFVKVLAEELP